VTLGKWRVTSAGTAEDMWVLKGRMKRVKKSQKLSQGSLTKKLDTGQTTAEKHGDNGSQLAGNGFGRSN